MAECVFEAVVANQEGNIAHCWLALLTECGQLAWFIVAAAKAQSVTVPASGGEW